jgi:hypothetical protein
VHIEITDADRRPLATDKRSTDSSGRLTVTDCRISAAVVSPYLGRELPNAESLGLDPSRVYPIYRDAASLKAAAPTFERVPLLIEHAPTTASEPQVPLVIGTVSNVRWQAPYLVADLTIWTAEGIEAVESGRQKDISCGYEFSLDMTSGVAPDGTPFSGRMLDVRGNHVAIVNEGRVPNAVVADHALPYGEIDPLTAVRRMQAASARPSALARLIPSIDRLA